MKYLKILLVINLTYFSAFASPNKKKPEFPKNLDVCFSPEEGCDFKLANFIRAAKNSIDIAIYYINRPLILDAIIDKQNGKKVKIRVIVNSQQRPKVEDTVTATDTHTNIAPPTTTGTPKPEHPIHVLQKNGVNIVFRSGKNKGIMHNKFTIVDGKMVETGSFNYTLNASERNRENQIYISNPIVVKKYQKEFEKMWNEKESDSTFPFIEKNLISADDF